ncbi:MAG: hypothetical protein PHV82_17795, partial [Victivallaceae bacterium]|nr:hypothetical protein [Victivallaceae bacterium]
NITLFDILAEPELDEAANIRRFITAQAILLAMPGIPALYYHTLFGSSSDRPAVEKTGLKRAVNRRKFNLPELENELTDPHSRTARIFSELKNIIAVRKSQPAFNPYCPAKIITLTEQLFAVLRATPDQKSTILTIHNLSAQTIWFRIPVRALPVNYGSLQNLFTGEKISLSETISIAAFGFTWLTIRT